MAKREFMAESDPFLLQFVAVGVGRDLSAAREAGRLGLRKRITTVRTRLGFPTIHGMCYALTNKLELLPEEGDKTTSATLTAWYHVDVTANRMTPVPHRFTGHLSTSIIEEYDVVFCEGY